MRLRGRPARGHEAATRRGEDAQQRTERSPHVSLRAGGWVRGCVRVCVVCGGCGAAAERGRDGARRIYFARGKLHEPSEGWGRAGLGAALSAPMTDCARRHAMTLARTSTRRLSPFARREAARRASARQLTTTTATATKIRRCVAWRRYRRGHSPRPPAEPWPRSNRAWTCRRLL